MTTTTTIRPAVTSPEGAAIYLGASRRWVYDLIDTDVLASCLVKGKRLIRMIDLENLVMPTPYVAPDDRTTPPS
jgi:hypothetical protein